MYCNFLTYSRCKLLLEPVWHGSTDRCFQWPLTVFQKQNPMQPKYIFPETTIIKEICKTSGWFKLTLAYWSSSAFICCRTLPGSDWLKSNIHSFIFCACVSVCVCFILLEHFYWKKSVRKWRVGVVKVKRKTNKNLKIVNQRTKQNNVNEVKMFNWGEQ